MRTLQVFLIRLAFAAQNVVCTAVSNPRAVLFAAIAAAPAFASATKSGQSLDNLYQDEIFALLQVYHLLKDIVFALHNHSGLKVVTAEIFNGLAENSILLKRVIGAAFGSMLLLRSAVFSGDNIGLNDSNGRFLRRHVTDNFHDRILREMVDCFVLRTDVSYTVRDAKSFTKAKLFGLLHNYIVSILPLNVPVWISESKLLLTAELYFDFDVGFVYHGSQEREQSQKNLYKDLYYAHQFCMRRN